MDDVQLFLESKEFWGAFIGTLGAILAAFLIYLLGRRFIEDTELRRMRVENFVALCSYRFCLAKDHPFGTDAETHFLAALNAVPALYSDHAQVMDAHRKFKDTSDTSRNIASLIRAISRVIKLTPTELSDLDLSTPYTRTPATSSQARSR